MYLSAEGWGGKAWSSHCMGYVLQLLVLLGEQLYVRFSRGISGKWGQKCEEFIKQDEQIQISFVPG